MGPASTLPSQLKRILSEDSTEPTLTDGRLLWKVFFLCGIYHKILSTSLSIHFLYPVLPYRLVATGIYVGGLCTLMIFIFQSIKVGVAFCLCALIIYAS